MVHRFFSIILLFMTVLVSACSIVDDSFMKGGMDSGAGAGSGGVPQLVNPPGGTLDGAFGNSGVQLDGFGGGQSVFNSVRIDSNGRLVLGGYDQAVHNEFLVARFNSDGSADTNFNGAGYVETPNTYDDIAFDVEIQPDSKILLTGHSNPTATFYQTQLVRFNTDGSLDSSFGSSGISDFHVGSGSQGDSPTNTIVQADGSIVVNVSVFASGVSEFGVARLLSNGSLDGAFGTGGRAIVSVTGADSNNSLVIQNNGELLLTGFSNWKDLSVIELSTVGTLDNTYGTAGSVITCPGNCSGTNSYNSSQLQSDGKLVAAGGVTQSAYTDEDFLVARYTSTGSLDSSFGIGGYAIIRIGPYDDVVNSVIVDPTSGKIIAAGYSNDGTNDQVAIVRLNTDGSLDTTFNGTGILVLSEGTGDSEIDGLAIQSDDKLVACGFAMEASNPVTLLLRIWQ
jgi:uncharacterized delta-60 repeat protein